ncbi:ABC transporter permease subunit [Paenibacillus marinisediminis]
MELRKQMLKSLFISMLSFILVILIVLFPRDMAVKIQGYGFVADEYKVNIEDYTNNIVAFFSDVLENKSLGKLAHTEITTESIIWSAFQKSILIILFALIIGYLLGVWKGIVDYKLSKTKFNVFGNWFTWFFQSIPDFLLILLIQWFLIKKVRVIPFFAQGEWYDFILPSILVAIYPVIYIARITSASLATQEGQLYILVARAKGISEFLILYKHMLANCFSTILTHLSPLFVYILSNLLMVEYFTNYPGLAYRMFRALDYSSSFGTGTNYNPGMIIGISFCFMVLILFVQLISQAAKRFVGPR